MMKWLEYTAASKLLRNGEAITSKGLRVINFQIITND